MAATGGGHCKIYHTIRMKINITILLSFLFTAVLFTSCDIETSDNGDLDGFWHLERVDTLSTGGSTDLSQAKLFWSFEVKLMALQGGSDRFYLRFNQTSDSLTVLSPYYNRGHEENDSTGDIPVTDPTAMSQYGIDSLEVHYKKEALSGSKMVLRSRRLRLYFKKF